jgi:hypothetical protein
MEKDSILLVVRGNRLACDSPTAAMAERITTMDGVTSQSVHAGATIIPCT